MLQYDRIHSIIQIMDRLDVPMRKAGMPQAWQRTYVINHFGPPGRLDDMLASAFRRECDDAKKL
jgi:hypothetical protein